MWLILLPMLAQVPVDRAVLESEHAREAGFPGLQAAISGSDPRAQRLAARAVGRIENPAHRDALIPLFSSPDGGVRRAAVGALAQMRATYDFAELLRAEKDASVRAVIYEAVGRAKPIDDGAEALLVSGFSDADARTRAGAARGLESFFRLNPAPRKPTAATLAALHAAFARNPGEELRELVLLTMNAAADADTSTIARALRDPSPQVRRLAVMVGRAWVNDTSPMVQYQALRVSRSCAKATEAIPNRNDHVAIAAVDMLGALKCAGSPLSTLVTTGRNWRIRAHALVALAAVDPAAAKRAMVPMMTDSVWQVRAWAADVARILKDSAALATLMKDPDANVAINAISTVDDAIRALRSDHAGLVLAGAERLKTAPDLSARLPRVVGAFNRLTEDGSMTMRDPRVALLTRIGEVADTSTNGLLRDALRDRDPAVAAIAAAILTSRTGAMVEPITTTLPIPPLPPASYIRGLSGASASIVMKGLGTITVDLLTDEAPVTIAVFAQLAESGQYNGLTFHRIVPNFVIQGGSPGADEFDGRSREFLRDEVGLARQRRGTIGISTRGRDTGDAQIYFNLVDNFRLDHDYTVMATMRSGLDVMDRVQEGDVIERIDIIRVARTSATQIRRK